MTDKIDDMTIIEQIEAEFDDFEQRHQPDTILEQIEAEFDDFEQRHQ